LQRPPTSAFRRCPVEGQIDGGVLLWVRAPIAITSVERTYLILWRSADVEFTRSRKKRASLFVATNSIDALASLELRQA
jgi:hypothetical protein